jgi:hypothetical protein
MIPANAHLANLRAVHLRRESPALGLTGDFRNRELVQPASAKWTSFCW